MYDKYEKKLKINESLDKEIEYFQEIILLLEELKAIKHEENKGIKISHEKKIIAIIIKTLLNNVISVNENDADKLKNKIEKLKDISFKLTLDSNNWVKISENEVDMLYKEYCNR